MNKVLVGSFEIDECATCHGLFFDNFELDKLDESHEGSGPDLERILSYEPSPDPGRPKLNCPTCDIKMFEHRFSAACEVRVDECGKCGGLWLEMGELGLIRKGFATEGERANLVRRLTDGMGLGVAEVQQTERGKELDARIEQQRSYGLTARTRRIGALVNWICTD